MWLFLFSAAVYAQGSESLAENDVAADANAAETKADASTKENTQEDEYNIYKKDNPKDPCYRGLDTYDYEKSW